MVTLLTDQGEAEVAAKPGSDLWVAPEDMTRATGWTLKPEGFCKGDVCVPVQKGREAAFVASGKVDLDAFWRQAGRPTLHSRKGDVWMLGEAAADRAAALAGLDAPDFTLPDLDGKLHSLSEQRGKKVLLTTWASW
jgi:hypothetical protein